MTEGVQPGAGGDAFDAIDPKLTVFALANGMDLAKGPDYRRLEWFTDGRERGIVIRADGSGAFDLTVMSWPTGHPEQREESGAGDGVGVDTLSAALTDAIDAANGLGPPP